MNAYELLAFVVVPIALAGSGWAVVLLSERFARKDQEHGQAGE